VLWLLEELGTPYEIVRYQRRRDLRAPAELRAIQPLGKSPDALHPSGLCPRAWKGRPVHGRTL